ncbi:TRAP transporter T-component domain-containing protein [Desulfonema limicola]|uniref:TRAP transporter T-component domain-containing protein n=1 Tax=Desulfonema limicola TaxID=45656 RepID=A0A975B7J6_9BACT|nr:TRAP transporter TatT component family protein [Desulfonema limicola]QTA80359.1 TRAP transporter T-component domain-containing protein [Desulfonema limicola]
MNILLPGNGFKYFFALFALLFSSGCVSAVTVNFARDLSYAVVNNNDLETVKTGAPAYLIMIDSFLYDDPKNESLLISAANLYTAYTDVYVEDKERASKMTDKAMSYALRAVCANRSDACLMRELDFESFTKIINKINDMDSIPSLYTLGAAWAAWIQAHQDDWNAVAEIARVEAIMAHIVKLQESYQDGGAHLYLGTLATLLPPALGGSPEKGRMHFERALEISGNKNLMAKVIYARQYARMIFDRDLHDRLLNDVLDANPEVEGYSLLNILAQKKAEILLKNADEFF